MEDTTEGTITYVPPGEGKSFWMAGGHMATFKVTSEDTGGAEPTRSRKRLGRRRSDHRLTFTTPRRRPSTYSKGRWSL